MSLCDNTQINVTLLNVQPDRILSINRLMTAVTLTVNMTFMPFRLVELVELTNQ